MNTKERWASKKVRWASTMERWVNSLVMWVSRMEKWASMQATMVSTGQVMKEIDILVTSLVTSLETFAEWLHLSSLEFHDVGE